LSRTATAVIFGKADRSTSSRLAVSSGVIKVNPVTLTRGRAKLPTRPNNAGSTPIVMMGISLVASIAMRAVGPPDATSTSTGRSTSFCANPGRRVSSKWASRNSRMMLRPST
jgi:hypothetical protein